MKSNVMQIKHKNPKQKPTCPHLEDSIFGLGLHDSKASRQSSTFSNITKHTRKQNILRSTGQA